MQDEQDKGCKENLFFDFNYLKQLPGFDFMPPPPELRSCGGRAEVICGQIVFVF